MSQKNRQEAQVRQREHYARAGLEHKTKILNEPVELFGYHRKSALYVDNQPESNVLETIDVMLTKVN